MRKRAIVAGTGFEGRDKIIKAHCKEGAGIKYPPPEGVVLGLPLEGDKIALPPKEARRAVPKQVLPLISNQNLFAQLLALAFLDTSHRHGSFLHPNLLYQHSSHGPKSDYPNTAFALTP